MKRIFLFFLSALLFFLCACSVTASIPGSRIFPAGASYEATFSVNGEDFPCLLELKADGALRLTLTDGEAKGAAIVADGEGCRWLYGDLEMPLAERTGKAEVLRRAIAAFREGTFSVPRSKLRSGENIALAYANENLSASLTLSPDLSPVLLDLSCAGDRIRIGFHRSIITAYSIPGE